MTQSVETSWTKMSSPIGPLVLSANKAGLLGVQMPIHRHERPGEPCELRGEPCELRADDHPVLRRAVEQLNEYFAGARRVFDIPLAPAGTGFQLRVWAALCQIEFGRTISYGTLAHRIGNPAASRAVGLANGRNPLPIVVPCHRVIGADGSLTGFGGGIDRKRWLLNHEAHHASSSLFALSASELHH